MKPGIIQIRIEGQNGERITVHGEGEGDRGIYLAEDGVDTLLAPTPEKQTWKTGARQRGSRPKFRKILHKDIDLTFLVKDTQLHTMEQNESYLLQAIGHELDEWDDESHYARVAVVTDMSGTRYMDVVQYEEMDYEPRIDPIRQQFSRLTLKVRCGGGDWYEPDFVSAFEFDNGPGEGFVEVHNPTPYPMLHSWGMTPGVWTFPDWSWRGKPMNRRPGGPEPERFITTVEILETDGYTMYHRDRSKLAVENENETNILARTGGQYLVYAIPPYTQRQRIPVFKDDAGPGRIELIQPRRWPRAWGGEYLA